MGMDTVQSTFQLPPTGCTNRKENHLYAWWHWEIYKFCRTDREARKTHYNGCWVYNFDGSSMVHSRSVYLSIFASLLYFCCLMTSMHSGLILQKMMV